MLDPEHLRPHLPVGDLGEPLHFFSQIGSTNDYARELAQEGAPHGTLVLADEQTAGRGRGDRNWSTPAGTALAFSLLLRPGDLEQASLVGLNALGALAVSGALEEWGLDAGVKWPNDVLLEGRKVAGVLVEADWHGEELGSVVMGIGLNVKRGSAPPDEQVRFPATDVEAAAGRSVDRHRLLLAVLAKIDRWWPRIGSEELRSAWEARLAYRGEWIELQSREERVRGQLIGIARSGQLRVETVEGDLREIGQEFLSLRPVDMNSK